MTRTLTANDFASWIEEKSGPVAVCLRQKLLPVDGQGGVIFPPTYANIRYNISTLGDGTKIAEIDSVGSQANRIEPEFAHGDRATLVPQITIKYDDNKDPINLLEAGHRLGDAVVRCTDLGIEVQDAFTTFLRSNDASDLAKIGPTSLVFGVWDSRNTQAKLPRIVQSVIRAHDVDELKRSAVYEAPIKIGDLKEIVGMSGKDEEQALKDTESTGDGKSPWSKRGFLNALSNETHGGVIARGPIERRITVNLVQIRRLEKGDELKKYILGLSLAAATAPMDPFLRAGCLLTPDPDAPSNWEIVGRDGTRETVALEEDAVMEFAKVSAKSFGVGEKRELEFDKALAKKDAGQEDTAKGKKKNAANK